MGTIKTEFRKFLYWMFLRKSITIALCPGNIESSRFMLFITFGLAEVPKNVIKHFLEIIRI